MTAAPKLNEVEKNIFHALKVIYEGTKSNNYTSSKDYKTLKLNPTARMMMVQSGIITTLGHKRNRKYMYTPDVVPNLFQVRRIYGMYQNYTQDVQNRKKERDSLPPLQQELYDEVNRTVEEQQEVENLNELPSLSVEKFFEIIRDAKELLMSTNPNIHVEINVEVTNKTKTKI